MHQVFAQAPTIGALESAGEGTRDVATIASLVFLIKNVIIAIVAFAGVVLFVMLIIGGMNFLFSGGDQKKLEKAKGTLTGALSGFIFLIASYLILKLIQTFTGVNVTTFGILQ